MAELDWERVDDAACERRLRAWGADCVLGADLVWAPGTTSVTNKNRRPKKLTFFWTKQKHRFYLCWGSALV